MGFGGVMVRLLICSPLFPGTLRCSGRFADSDVIAVSFACSSVGFVLSLLLREKRLGRAT